VAVPKIVRVRLAYGFTVTLNTAEEGPVPQPLVTLTITPPEIADPEKLTKIGLTEPEVFVAPEGNVQL